MSTAPGLDSAWEAPPTPISLHRRRLRLSVPPAPLAPLIGRDAEVVVARDILARREARLVTLVGPGGIGKTRLALAVAAACAPGFDGQVAWVPVATATTPDAVAAAVAQAVGAIDSGAGATIEALRQALRDQRLLLVVDNLEQALDAAPLLTDLLHACPDLALLVTSRALLRVTGERALDVPPLAALPDPKGSKEIAEAPPAVQLFAQQAASVSPAFALTPENAPAIAEICRRLDGLPLAIELAAARSTLFPPAALLARLGRRLPELTAGQRDAPERHRTMRDAIAWSYDLLTPAEQSVFQCLSVFAGGCTLEAAEAVCQGSSARNDTPAATVATVVESLVAQSLLRVAPPLTDDGAPRLTMLETVHEFAAEQRSATGDADPDRRHAAYYLELALRAEPTYWGDAPGYQPAGIKPELDNVRVARGWAMDHGEADMALRLTAAMFDPHRMTGDNVREQWAWTRRALALPGGSAEARAAALTGAAWLALVGFDGAEAQALGADALAQARRVGDALGVANAAAALGVIRLHAGDEPGARRLLEEALAGFQPMRASGRIGWTLTHLAWLDGRDAVDEGGDPEALTHARTLYDEALARFRAIGHPHGIARALHGVAYVTYKQRDLHRALATTQEVLSLGWDQRWPVFSYLEDIADIAGRAGQAETAARLYGAASAQRARFGLPLEPPYRDEYERDAAVARRALGDEAFAEAWRAGGALEPERAVAEALAVTVSTVAVAPPPPLSPRELEVLRLLATGLSDRDIAGALFIGERTVNTHVARLFAKLGVRNRAAAVAAAVAAGLVDPSASPVDLS